MAATGQRRDQKRFFAQKICRSHVHYRQLSAWRRAIIIRQYLSCFPDSGEALLRAEVSIQNSADRLLRCAGSCEASAD